jgi:hypothetical protein
MTLTGGLSGLLGIQGEVRERASYLRGGARRCQSCEDQWDGSSRFCFWLAVSHPGLCSLRNSPVLLDSLSPRTIVSGLTSSIKKRRVRLAVCKSSAPDQSPMRLLAFNSSSQTLAKKPGHRRAHCNGAPRRPSSPGIRQWSGPQRISTSFPQAGAGIMGMSPLSGVPRKLW